MNMKRIFLLFIIMFFSSIQMVYANELLIDHIQEKADQAGLVSTSTDMVEGVDLAYDGTTDANLRYIGVNPNNYVFFNNELWRIIGIMNNIKDADGNVGSRIKIVRANSIGEYSWSASPTDVNNGWGDNEWTFSTANCILTHYYNGTSGICHNDSNYEEFLFDGTETSLSQEARNLVIPVEWNIGSIRVDNYMVTVSGAYRLERSNSVPTKCNASGCHDNGFEGSVRKSSWIGSIGLIYPSDYGFATSGNGNNEKRLACVNQNRFFSTGASQNWAAFRECYNFDWLNLSDFYAYKFYTMTPFGESYHESFSIFQRRLSSSFCYGLGNYHPVVYLKNDIYLYAGDGSQDNPYIISGFHVIVDNENDSVVVDKDSDLSEGQDVLISINKEGYTLEELTILDMDENEIAYEKVSDTEYRFVMPSSDVRIHTSFKKNETPIVNPNTTNHLFMIFLVLIFVIITILWSKKVLPDGNT